MIPAAFAAAAAARVKVVGLTDTDGQATCKSQPATSEQPSAESGKSQR